MLTPTLALVSPASPAMTGDNLPPFSFPAVSRKQVNAHYDERCFLPIHVDDNERSRPVALVLRPGKTPSGVEVRAHLRRLVRRIRKRWKKTRITFRGDGHYARPEAMAWCEENGVDYIFGPPGAKPLARKADEAADAIRTGRALESRSCAAMPRRCTGPNPGAASGAPSPVSRLPRDRRGIRPFSHPAGPSPASRSRHEPGTIGGGTSGGLY